jgi:hypothetical protein
MIKTPLLKPQQNPGGLTDDQYRAAKDIHAWYNSNELIYTLYGAAGTGKTYLLNYLLKHTFIHPTCVTAPTHKAVKVIESVTGRKGKTLQSLHGLRPDVNLEDFDINKVKFSPLGNDTIKSYKLVIIDECSQVGDALYQLNLKRAKEYNTKILFLGDACQLSPINERYSKTFTVARKSELVQIVRQEDTNPLLKLFTLLRQDTRDGGNRFLNYIQNTPTDVNENGEGYICVNVDKFQEEIVKVFKSKEFELNPQGFVRYAAYTNPSVGVWNNYIRNTTLNEHDAILTIDDLLVGYKTIVDEYNTPVIINSEDYIIEALAKRITDDGFEVYVASMRSLLDGRSITTFIVDHKSDTFHIFRDIITRLRYNAIKSNGVNRGRTWRAYFEYKNKFLCLQEFTVRNDDNQDVFVPKDLDYGYGLTIHKLQGTTITHIFINLLDICFYNGDKNFPLANSRTRPYTLETRNKLIYTALSRAKKIAILLV